MSMIHKQTDSLRKIKINDPLEKIARKLSRKYKLICFDELEIIDIADAMIVSKLFKMLLEKNISFIITSNFKPSNLYKFGLQREQFLPFIETIEKEMHVINVNNNFDLRSNKKHVKNFYYSYPLDSISNNIFLKTLNLLKKDYTFKTTKILSLGRELVFDKTIENILVTDFDFICSYKFSPNDYIAISKKFKWFFIDNFPVINRNMINEARRFITLIDIIYEKKTNLVIRAEKKIENIFDLKKNKDLPFRRTTSRIREMTSKHWVKN